MTAPARLGLLLCLAVSAAACGGGQPAPPPAPAPPATAVVVLPDTAPESAPALAEVADAAVEAGEPPAAAMEVGDATVPELVAVPPGLEASAPTVWGVRVPPGAGPRNAVVVVNVDAMRAMPAFAPLSAVAGRLPPWNELSAPALGLGWVLVAGPSLVRTERDVVLLRVAADDATIDRWLDALGAKAPSRAAVPMPTTPDVHAVSVHVDGATRVAMRAGHHVVAFVPPGAAAEASRALLASPPPEHVASPALLGVRLLEPHRVIPKLAPDGVTELRLAVAPTRADGADVVLEEDAPTAARARKPRDDLIATIDAQNTMAVRLVLAGILDHVEATTNGRTVTVRLHATPDQVRNVINLLGVMTGGAGGP